MLVTDSDCGVWQCREQRIAGASADVVDAGDKVSYLEQAPSLRLALGRLSLERRSMRATGQDEDDADMHQVEMLLQAYFIQMDNTFNRLDTMNEYISDTEVCLMCLVSILCCSCAGCALVLYQKLLPDCRPQVESTFKLRVNGLLCRNTLILRLTISETT